MSETNFVFTNELYDGSERTNTSPWPEPDPNKRLYGPDGQPVNFSIRLDEEEGSDGDELPGEISVPIPPSIDIVCEGIGKVLEMRKPRIFIPWPAPIEKPDEPKQNLKAA